MAKAIRHVFITSAAFLRITLLASMRGDDETGGPMVGYITTDHALVVTNVGGPGLRGRVFPYSVMIDGEHAAVFCAQEQDRSNGLFRFVGDWHVHPSEDVSPSPTDRNALRTLPRHNDWGYPIVSIIFGASLQERNCIHRTRWSHRLLGVSLLD